MILSNRAGAVGSVASWGQGGRVQNIRSGKWKKNQEMGKNQKNSGREV